MKPTVGRIVHYTNLGDREGVYPPEIQAALITKVVPSPIKCLHVGCLSAGIGATYETDEGDHLCTSHAQASEDRAKRLPEEAHYQVSLHVFYPTGDFKMEHVVFTEADAGTEQARGQWTWPQLGQVTDGDGPVRSARSSLRALPAPLDAIDEALKKAFPGSYKAAMHIVHPSKSRQERLAYVIQTAGHQVEALRATKPG